MGIGDRLKEERERLGFNQTEFAAMAGASKNSQYNYEKGDRSPDADYLAAVAERGVDVLYVITGIATPQVVEGFTADEDQLVNRYRALPPSDRDAINRVLSAMWEISSKVKE